MKKERRKYLDQREKRFQSRWVRRFKREGICFTHMADSLCCTAEADIEKQSYSNKK